MDWASSLVYEIGEISLLTVLIFVFYRSRLVISN